MGDAHLSGDIRPEEAIDFLRDAKPPDLQAHMQRMAVRIDVVKAIMLGMFGEGVWMVAMMMVMVVGEGRRLDKIGMLVGVK